MKHKSVGKRIALAFAAVAIGFAVWIIWVLLGMDTSEMSGKLLHLFVGLVVMGYLIYRWSIKR